MIYYCYDIWHDASLRTWRTFTYRPTLDETFKEAGILYKINDIVYNKRTKEFEDNFSKTLMWMELTK